MAMRRPSARCTPNTVMLRKVASYTADAAGGKIPGRPVDTPGISCSVQPSSAEDVAPHLREDQVTYHTVIFHDDPGLSLSDQIVWGARVLNVTGVLDSSGRGRSYKTLCEERT